METSAKRPHIEFASEEDPLIKINAGGRILQTRCSTLTQNSTYFANMLSGTFSDSNRELFVDCCGDVFEHVLHFFRHKKLRRSTPLTELTDVANMLSIDSLCETLRHYQAVQKLVGVWHWRDPKAEVLQTPYFTIYEDCDRLWYQQVAFATYIMSEVVKHGDHYLLVDDDDNDDGLKGTHILPRGGDLLLAYGKNRGGSVGEQFVEKYVFAHATRRHK